jgi:hypothetical protein
MASSSPLQNFRIAFSHVLSKRAASAVAAVFLLCLILSTLPQDKRSTHAQSAYSSRGVLSADNPADAEGIRTSEDENQRLKIFTASVKAPPPLVEGASGVEIIDHDVTEQRWLRLEGTDPLPHYLWIPLALLTSGDPHLRDSSWGVLMYLHGAGEAGDDLSLLTTNPGAMGTPPQIVEGRVLPRSSAHDGAAASASTHPLRNGTLSGAPFQTLVIAPQSNLMWPYDPHRLDKVAQWIRLLGNVRGPAALHLAGYSLPTTDASGTTLTAQEIKSVGLLLQGVGASLRVDVNRFVVSGASQGGYAVLEIVTREDMIDVPAVFVALCGFSIDDDRIARDMIRRIDRNKGTQYTSNRGDRRQYRPQLVMAHGRNDVVVPSLATSQIVQRIIEKGAHHLQVVKVPRSVSIGAALQEHPRGDSGGGGSSGSIMRSVVFFDVERSFSPLDLTPVPSAIGHAVWRDMFAASSPIWLWLQ